MKTIKKGIVLLILSLFLTLTACSSGVEQTKVKVIGLSYDDQYTISQSNNKNFINLSFNKMSSEKYFYPGDNVQFTVKLEDPDYEFISLLAIKFNNETIRANVGNSIVETRDCGQNICIDFPFEVQAGVTEYTVQEVKFAKLNDENGLSAIIDGSSNNTVSLNVYDQEIYQYVEESVNFLQSFIDGLKFYTDEEMTLLLINNPNIKDDVFNMIKSRTFKVEEPNQDVFSSIYPDNNSLENIWYFDRNEKYDLDQQIALFWGWDLETIDRFDISDMFVDNWDMHIHIGLLTDEYNGMTVINKGNEIYLVINGVQYHFLTMGPNTRFVSLENSGETS